MHRVVLTLLNMMRLRSGPQDMPASSAFTLLLALVYVVQGLYADRILGEPDTTPRSLVAIAVQFAAISLLLNVRGLATRVNQTLSALAGTGFLFGVISIILLLRFDPEEPQVDLVFYYLALVLWSLGVDAHIYRSALSVKMATGVLVAVLIFLANFMLLRSLFG